MESKEDKNVATELINFKSGINLGYSLASLDGDPNIINTIKSIVSNNPQSAYCRGINKGYERAILDRQNEMTLDSDNRMQELTKLKNKSKDNIDLDR